jgi:hypothetical protein
MEGFSVCGSSFRQKRPIDPINGIGEEINMAKALGVGGVFFKSEDSEKLGEWYQRWLGVPVEHPYGASFRPDGMPAGGLTVWAPFKSSTSYFKPLPKRLHDQSGG